MSDCGKEMYMEWEAKEISNLPRTKMHFEDMVQKWLQINEMRLVMLKR